MKDRTKITRQPENMRKIPKHKKLPAAAAAGSKSLMNRPDSMKKAFSPLSAKTAFGPGKKQANNPESRKEQKPKPRPPLFKARRWREIEK